MLGVQVTGLAILSDYLDHIRYSLFAESVTQSSSSRSSTRANGQSHGAAEEEAGQSSSSSSWSEAAQVSGLSVSAVKTLQEDERTDE